MSDLDLQRAKRVVERHGFHVVPDPSFAILKESAELRLVNVMRDLSEGHYCAGWYTELEHWLWDAISENPPRHPLSPEEVDLLRALRVVTGGWWYWSHDADLGVASPETFISREQFEARHAAWIARGREPLPRGRA